MVLLHGLFGSGGNLGALARALQGDRCVYSLDLPNHGRSDWMTAPSLSGMAGALVEWMQQQGLATVEIVGHSLGGKVAMQLALEHPQRVAALVVADIAPVAYPPSHDAVFTALEAVAAASCSSRQAAATVMNEYLQEAQVVQFLLTSLRRDDDGVYRWRFNLEALREGYGAVRAAPAAPAPYLGPVLFIKGSESDYIREEHRSRILDLFPAAEMKIMPGCGHWLHAEQPELFNRLVRRFLLTD